MQQSNDISSVFEDAHVRQCPKGQILLYQGQKTDDVFRIETGYVKVYDITSEGTEKLLMILGPDDIFPLSWTFKSNDSLHYFYETIDDTSVCVIKRSVLLEAIRCNHKLTLHVLEYFVNRTYDLMSRIECIEATSAKHKVAQVLLYLATSHGDEVASAAYRVRIPTTHQMIADMAGLNRSTASIQMKQLADEKMFKDTASGGFIIHTDRINTFLEKQPDNS